MTMMKCHIFIFIFLYQSLYSYETESCSVDSNDHYKHASTSNLMFSLQTGYAWIKAKNNHMENDSGILVGFHAMHHNTLKILDRHFYLAAGLHKTWSIDPHVGAMFGLMYPINDNLSVSFMPGYVWMKHSAHNDLLANVGMPNMPMNMNMTNKKHWESEYSNHFELHSKTKIFNYLIKTSLSWMTSRSHSLISLGFNFDF